MQIFDASQVVAHLSITDLHHRRGWIGRIPMRCELGLSSRASLDAMDFPAYPQRPSS